MQTRMYIVSITEPLVARKRQELKMNHNGRELVMLGDDGNGNRLWLDRETDTVANESYDATTMESNGLDSCVEGWGYNNSDVMEGV